MKIIKTYRKDIFGRNLRAVTEKKLFSDGYAVDSEEEIKEWNAGQACLILILFFPLIFCARIKKIKVTYYK